MEKFLPQNIEAEVGVLGSIIIDPDALRLVTGFLKAEDFYRESHRIIYEVILALNNGQENIERVNADYITICDELERRGKLEKMGGAGYITSLINQVPTSGNIVFYARIVERTGILRALIGVAGQIAAFAYDDQEESLTSILSRTEKLIFEVSQRYLLSQRSDIDMPSLMNEYMSLIEARYQNRGQVVGVPSGYIDLDRILGGFQKSDLDILAARTSVGKSALAFNFAYNAASRERKVGIFSLEMSREQLAQRFVSMLSRVEQQRLRTGWIDDSDWVPIVDAIGLLTNTGIWIDDTPSISLSQLESRARRWVSEHGVEFIIVDYLQLLITDSDDRRHENRVQEVSLISRRLKSLARELNIPILALAQLSREVEKRQSKVPMLSDLRESGSIEQDSDVVMFIYRDELYNLETDRVNQADIIIAKNRNGPTGTITLGLDVRQSLFTDLGVVDAEESDSSSSLGSIIPFDQEIVDELNDDPL